MSSTDWIQELKVAELKEELKKRGQPVAGKKAELTARLEEYVKEHEAGSVEEPAVEEEKAEAAAEQAAPAAEEAATAAQEERAPEKEAKAAKEREPKAAPAAKAEVVPAEAKVPAADDVDLDYGESDDEQPQKQEAKPAEESAEKPVAAAAGAEPSKKQKEQEQEMKKKKKAEPDSRKRPTSDVPQSEEEARPEKQAKTEQQHTKPKQPAGSDAPAVPATTEKAQQQQERKPGSRALLIEGFVRPFTENQARTLLGQSGTVVAMWMPSIRNLAWVVYSTTSEAEAAKTALFKLQWPAGSPKVLMPRSVSIRAAEKAIGHGNGNEDFKIERSEEDGPDEAEIENNTSKSMDVVGTITIPAGHPSSLRQQQQATADDEEVLKDASPLRVKDLRELLSRKSTGGVRTAERKRRDPGPNLDELFRKTTAKPAIYWMPLSEEAVELKKKAKAATAGAGGSGGGQGGYSKR